MPLAATVSPGIPVVVNAAGDTVWRNTGTVAEVVDPVTNDVLEPGKAQVLPAGTTVLVGPAGDRSDEITATADLATLKADGTDGDGFFGGGAFTAGQFVVLDDNSVANYSGTIWAAGVA